MKAPVFPATISVPELASLCGLPDRTCRDALAAQDVPALGRVDFRQSVRAVVASRRKPTADIRDEMLKVQLDKALLTLSARKGELCRKDHAADALDKLVDEFRSIVAGALYLNENQRGKLLTKIDGIKVEPPEPTEP